MKIQIQRKIFLELDVDDLRILSELLEVTTIIDDDISPDYGVFKNSLQDMIDSTLIKLKDE